MVLMIAKQRVASFDSWEKVFYSHQEAQKEAGLYLLHVVRNMSDQQEVYAIFEVKDLSKAKAFVTSPGIPEAQRLSGVIGETEIVFLK